MPQATQRRVLRKMLTTAATVAVLLLILGGLLTRLLHVSPGALGVASGIVLLIIAVTMVLGQHEERTPAATRPKTRTRCRPLSSRWPCPTCSTRPGSSPWSPPRAHHSLGVWRRCVGILIVILALDRSWCSARPCRSASHLDPSRCCHRIFGFLLAALAVAAPNASTDCPTSE